MLSWITNTQSDPSAVPTDFAEELFHAICKYGVTADETMIEPLGVAYERACRELSEDERMELLLGVIPLVEDRRSTVNGFFPFIYKDNSRRIISTAVLHAAGAWSGSEEDPMRGVREMVGWARRYADRGDYERAAAILGGLAFLGDRRVFQTIGPCWRWFPPEHRQLLLDGVKGITYAGVVDWLVSWMEECEGGEFGSVAGTFVFIPSIERTPHVWDVRRALPVWSVPQDEVITVLETVSFKEYGSRLRRRLLQIAADEQAPRVMHKVLATWGIDHTRRLSVGVSMRGGPDSPGIELRVSPEAISRGTHALDNAIYLPEEAFNSRTGTLLLSWPIFNPYGPTWSCIGLMPTDEPGTECLFYRMLNPFKQESAAIGFVRGADTSDPLILGNLLRQVFSYPELRLRGGGTFSLFGDSAPSFIDVCWSDPPFQEAVQSALADSPGLRPLDIHTALADMTSFRGRPWDLATAQITRSLARPQLPGTTTSAHDVRRWLELAQDAEHISGYLIHYPSAWHGAIDQQPGTLGQNAFTFWQLGDFLSRFGYLMFEEVAAAFDRREMPELAENTTTTHEASNPLPAEPTYQQAYDLFREKCEAQPADAFSPTLNAVVYGHWVVGIQMAAAEAILLDRGQKLNHLRRLARKPWPLGYMFGVALGLIRKFEIDARSSDAEFVKGEILLTGIGRISTVEAFQMVEHASSRPEFREGLEASVADALESGDETISDRLREWLTQ